MDGRYYMRPAEIDPEHSWSVFDRASLNEANEPYCVEAAITEEQAQQVVDKLNAEAKQGAPHKVVECVRLKGIHLQYSYKNWSDRFECPVCKASRRASLNRLGHKNTLVCDGKHIHVVVKDALCLRGEG